MWINGSFTFFRRFFFFCIGILRFVHRTSSVKLKWRPSTLRSPAECNMHTSYILSHRSNEVSNIGIFFLTTWGNSNKLPNVSFMYRNCAFSKKSCEKRFWNTLIQILTLYMPVCKERLNSIFCPKTNRSSGICIVIIIRPVDGSLISSNIDWDQIVIFAAWA